MTFRISTMAFPLRVSHTLYIQFLCYTCHVTLIQYLSTSCGPALRWCIGAFSVRYPSYLGGCAVRLCLWRVHVLSRNQRLWLKQRHHTCHNWGDRIHIHGHGRRTWPSHPYCDGRLLHHLRLSCEQFDRLSLQLHARGVHWWNQSKVTWMSGYCSPNRV